MVRCSPEEVLHNFGVPYAKIEAACIELFTKADKDGMFVLNTHFTPFNPILSNHKTYVYIVEHNNNKSHEKFHIDETLTHFLCVIRQVTRALMTLN